MTASREKLPVVPLRGLVVLPGELLHFDAGRPKTVGALQSAVEDDSVVFLVSQKDPRKNDITGEDVFQIGTVCKIRQILRIPGDSVRVLAEGIARARADEFHVSDPFFEAEVLRIEDIEYDKVVAEALRRRVSERFQSYCSLSGRVNADTMLNVEDLENISDYADAVAEQTIHKVEDKQRILETIDPIERMSTVHEIIGRELEILRVDKRIAAQVRKQVDKNQKDYYLREQIRAIQKELGDSDGSEIEQYRDRMEAKKLPEAVRVKLTKEIDRLEALPAGSHEAPGARNYIELVLDLPWSESTLDNLELQNAQRVLNEDHFALEKVKERVLEHIAVTRLSGGATGQILCFVGPPGVGKTSVCSSIARALGRKFVRMSLGGIRDEAELRGHRRTYIGAMPGRVIAALKQAGTVNPLLLFDEIDKLGQDMRGDPASAMLEVLDSAQNFEFRDHYLELPYDLSKVMFVTTANSTENIPKPLLDRMELIRIEGYLEDEKIHIAQRHLIKKQMEKHGLQKGMLTLSDANLRAIINGYTSEAGVRELERSIAKVCRKAACEIVEGKPRVRMNRQKLLDYLGQPKYRHEAAETKAAIGLVNGLAWTAAGGETLTVEAQVYNGSGQILLTGHLGDVMQESAKAALTFVRAHGEEYGLQPDFYMRKDIHVHVPEGATPKDGPSAGVTMMSAMLSAFTGIPVKAGVAMTGEITLRGRVLAVGGLREKLLAAVRAGIHTIIVPEANRKDIEEVPENVRELLEIVYADTAAAVLRRVLVRSNTASEYSLVPQITKRGQLVQ